ncbi:MAG: SLC13 family permease [Gammaproteobacteria bacterium]|nr:SLC13 family permease [Gammaproteobacteria bacterium]MBL6998484.1 SLC13 family permease [Gammaproteobacteria bacterium]
MGWEGWFSIAVTTLCFSTLALTRYSADIVMVGGLTLLLLAGVLSPEQALSGLANEGMVTVGVLYVVVAGLRQTGGIAWIVQSVLGRPQSLRFAQIRMMAPVALISAFLNNTPVVAMFIPAISDWSKRNRLSVSKLMIPLSYASIAGGTCTLIGSSTNLVVNGLLIRETGTGGLSMLELAWVGIPLTLMVFGFILVGSQWLLPERVPAISRYDDAREYTVEMLVEQGSKLGGKSVEEAGLRQLPGMFLIQIERQGQIMAAVSSYEILHDGDRLVFAGVIESVVDLQKIQGLIPASNQIYKLGSSRQDRVLVEAVVSDSCPLAGKSVCKGHFRNFYNAVIIAVARNGKRVHQKIGDIVLRPGDTLLLEAHRSFAEQQRNSRDFFLVSKLDDANPPQYHKAMLAMMILAFMVVCVATGLLSMLKASLLAAGLMIIGGCTSGREARRSVDWQILIVIAASFGLGSALHTTGAAQSVAVSLVQLAGGSTLISLSLMFAVTALLSALATNNAAAVIMFPIAVTTAENLGVSVMPFVITLMIAASASFATPIGYQTNLMVYGVGGYRFSDYLRIGAPLTVLVGLTTVLIVPQLWQF